jgi:hypothetical protein
MMSQTATMPRPLYDVIIWLLQLAAVLEPWGHG